ncbi:hypothetical protein IFR05_012470 [Cadophora sp. M221]|nr:hypothetical protein IFR05_012470 [Cadophora sp. M221]
MSFSPAQAYASFLNTATECVKDALKTYKDGAFKDDPLSGNKNLTELFDILLDSKLTTTEEKELCSLGRSITLPFNGPPPMDEVHRRMGLFLNKVASVLLGTPTSRMGPMNVLDSKGNVAFTFQFGDDGRPVAMPGGHPGMYPSMEMGEGRPTLFTYPGQTPRLPLAELEKAAETVEKTKAKKKQTAKDRMVTPVHPSTLLAFPDITRPPPDEIDNYPLVMDYLAKSLITQAKEYKNGAFKVRITEKTDISKIFKLLIGSSLTTPDEKEVLRHGLEWIEYLQSRFGGLVHLSRFHSMLYSGVFLEKVFCVFRDDQDQAKNKNKENRQPADPPKKPQRLWGLQHVDNGINDRLVVADDWSIARIPEGSEELKDDPEHRYRVKMTPEGGELHSAFGKVKDLSDNNGMLDLSDVLDPEDSKDTGDGDSDKPNIDPEIFKKITTSWLGDNPTRTRTHKGQYSMEELAENGLKLQQELGRLPTRDELLLDMMGALLSDGEFRAEVDASSKEAK